MLRRKYLTANRIHSNLTLRPFLANCVISLTKIMKIPLNFGNALVASNRDFIRMSTKIPSHSIRLLPTHAKYLGIIARNLIVTTLLTNGKQALDGKEKHFLDLLYDNFNTIKPAYTKGGLWLQVFGHSNSLCARAMRAITNYAPIGEYRLRFFSNEDFKCPCNNYSIESRRHILHECRRFNRYWNPRRDSLNHFTMFLITNPNAFAFTDS